MKLLNKFEGIVGSAWNEIPNYERHAGHYKLASEPAIKARLEAGEELTFTSFGGISSEQIKLAQE